MYPYHTRRRGGWGGLTRSDLICQRGVRAVRVLQRPDQISTRRKLADLFTSMRTRLHVFTTLACCGSRPSSVAAFQTTVGLSSRVIIRREATKHGT